MHRTDVNDESGRPWYVFHNGDWSGEAVIRPADDHDAPDIKVPGWIIKNACKRAFVAEVQGVIESALDEMLEGA